jgi:hypothetical protein
MLFQTYISRLTLLVFRSFLALNRISSEDLNMNRMVVRGTDSKKTNFPCLQILNRTRLASSDTQTYSFPPPLSRVTLRCLQYLTTLMERQADAWITNRKGFGKRCYPEIWFKGLGKTMKASLSQDSRCPSRDSNRAPTQYKSEAVPLCQPVRSNWNCGICMCVCDSTVRAARSCIFCTKPLTEMLGKYTCPAQNIKIRSR